MMTWISTRRGKRIDFADPDPDTIDIRDIADGLAAMPRWCGHTSFQHKPCHYSVAQHSVLAAKMCPRHALAALLHDAAEAYMGDCPRPLKLLLGPAWNAIETRLQRTIFTKYGLAPEIPEAVKGIDDRLLFTEKRDLQPRAPAWEWNGVDPFDWAIVPWPMQQAREVFLSLFQKLMATQGRGAA